MLVVSLALHAARHRMPPGARLVVLSCALNATLYTVAWYLEALAGAGAGTVGAYAGALVALNAFGLPRVEPFRELLGAGAPTADGRDRFQQARDRGLAVEEAALVAEEAALAAALAAEEPALEPALHCSAPPCNAPRQQTRRLAAEPWLRDAARRCAGCATLRWAGAALRASVR